jgi:hypothetical protein
MANSVNHAAAGDRPFTLVMEFTGPGGGMYAIEVDRGVARLHKEHPSTPDVRMTLDPVTFNCVMIRRMSNPILSMITGRLRVKGLSRMGRMQKIIREPRPDDRLTGSLFA